MDVKPEDLVFERMESQGDVIGLLSRLFDVADPNAVFTEPVEAGEYTVITASELIVTMGAGYGGGIGPSTGAEDDEDGEANLTSGGGGGGGGVSNGRPVAAIAVGPGGMKVAPIVDPTKITIAFFTTFAAMIVTLSQIFGLVRNRKNP